MKRIYSFTAGINHYIETTKVLPLELKLLGINNFKWKNYYNCLGGKILEYFLSADFIVETIRTYLVENLQIDKNLVNKMFPYNYKDFEYTSNIIKSDELKNLKKKISEEKNEINIEENNQNSQYNQYNQNNLKIPPRKDDYNNNENINPYTLNRGSNNFVISGKFTNTGKPILVNDPHLMNGIPTFWYISNMKIGKEFNFSGANHPGIPVYFFGTNSHISWGITNGLVDTSDILKVKRGKNPDEIILDGQVKKLKIRNERIYLSKDRKKFKDLVIYESPYGPIINGYFSPFFKTHHFITLDFEDQEEFYYILTGNYLEENFSNGFAEVFKQKDIKSFRDSLKAITISTNMVYIDVMGKSNKILNL